MEVGMAAHNSDTCRLSSKDYTIVSCSVPIPFAPESQGLKPLQGGPDCYRGYFCEYEIENGWLFLERLYIRTADETYPSVNGKTTSLQKLVPVTVMRKDPDGTTRIEKHMVPEQEEFMFYKDIHLPVPYTGTLTLRREGAGKRPETIDAELVKGLLRTAEKRSEEPEERMPEAVESEVHNELLSSMEQQFSGDSIDRREWLREYGTSSVLNGKPEQNEREALTELRAVLEQDDVSEVRVLSRTQLSDVLAADELQQLEQRIAERIRKLMTPEQLHEIDMIRQEDILQAWLRINGKEGAVIIAEEERRAIGEKLSRIGAEDLKESGSAGSKAAPEFLHYTPKAIKELAFDVVYQGYSPQEVDEMLEKVKADYEAMEKLIETLQNQTAKPQKQEEKNISRTEKYREVREQMEKDASQQ